MKTSFWRRWCNSLRSAKPTGPVSRARPRRRPLGLDALEDRVTPSETPVMIADINPGLPSSYPSSMVAIGSTTYFLADDGVHGGQMWKSDGTAAGTVMVKDFNYLYWWEAPNGLINVNGTLFFSFDDGVLGRELWKSDGTAAGTVMVKDIRPGGQDSLPLSPIFHSKSVNGTLFFLCNDGVHGGELWKSDGTAAGTVMVKDINPGGANNYTIRITDVNGTLFFVANDGVHGRELWKSDGTAAGTVMVKDITSGGSSFPNWDIPLKNVNGTLFFKTIIAGTGEALWKSDGTAAGTVIVKDVDSSESTFTDVNGTLFFLGDDGVHGGELWKSDGTAAGTVMVKDINPGGSSNPSLLIDVDGTLYFKADDGTHGAELWRSDGTTAGTTLVKDIYPGGSWHEYGGYYQYPNGYIPPWSTYVNNSSDASKLTNMNGTLFFSAYDGENGGELWQSDGTVAGTALIADINPGTASSFPENLTNANGVLFFSAIDLVHGTELWMLAENSLPSLTIGDATVTEGHEGTQSATFTVTLSGASAEPVTVAYTTADGTGAAGSDYQAASETMTFASGETSKIITVLVNGDRLGEPNETFLVNLSSPTNATIADGKGVCTIVDDEPRISIGDKLVTEGNTGSTSATFTVTLSAAYDVNVTVNYSTADGSAAAGSDYQVTSGTLTIPAGQTTGTITVLVNGDRLGEPNETFFVNLSAPTNATTVDGHGIGTILDDEPRMSINDVTVAEGNTGTTNATFTVSLSVAYDAAVTVNYQTANGSATAGSDYAAASGDVTIAAGQSTKTFTVAVIGDRSPEPSENFVVNLSAATNGLIVDSQGIGAVLDNEPRISISDVTKAEGKKNQTTLFTFSVILSAPYDQAVTMSYSTGDGTAKTSDNDYVAKTGTITFAAGETTKTITIEVKGDSKKETGETFYLDLSGLSSNGLFTKSLGIGTILNDD